MEYPTFCGNHQRHRVSSQRGTIRLSFSCLIAAGPIKKPSTVLWQDPTSVGISPSSFVHYKDKIFLLNLVNKTSVQCWSASTGEISWQNELQLQHGDASNVSLEISRPYDTLILLTSSSLQAMQASTGDTLWKTV